jgi:hypothetical protein
VCVGKEGEVGVVDLMVASEIGGAKGGAAGDDLDGEVGAAGVGGGCAFRRAA